MSYTRLPLEAAPPSVRLAREATRRWLDAVGRPLAEYAAAIVVSELVTNAIVHARSPIALHLWNQRRGIKIGVSDGSGLALPSPRGSTHAVGSGRGLHLVDALSTRWGYDMEKDGKLTWAEITAQRG